MEKAIWLIDADYFISSIGQLNKSHIDPKKFKRYINDLWQTEDIIWFSGWDPVNKGQMEFFKELADLGYTVDYKEITIGELAKNPNRYTIFVREMRDVLGKIGEQREDHISCFKEIKELMRKMEIKSDLDFKICYQLGRIPSDYKSKTVILLSGDGDFTEALWSLRLSGYRIVVMGFKENTSLGLKNVSHEFIDLNNILPLIIKKVKEKPEEKKVVEEGKIRQLCLFVT